MPPKTGVQAGRIPVTVTPNDFTFQACVDSEPRTMQRFYRIQFTKPGRLKLSKFKLKEDDVFSMSAPTKVELEEDGSIVIEVLFRPDKAGDYKARIEFKASFKKPRQKNSTITTVRIRMTGKGEICLDDDEEGPGNAGEGEEGADTAGGQNDTDTSTDQDGGGVSPGSQETEYSGPMTTLCVRFWKLPGAPNPSEDDLDTLLRRTNVMFGGSGVRFERSVKAITESEVPRKQVDPHCIDIYIGGPDHFPGAVRGKAAMSGKDTDKKAVKDAGAHGDFNDACGGLGEHITVETGIDANTLAHELGHFLGLGPAPNPDASPQKHLDPTDGKPITHHDRLMRPENAGDKLTDRERHIAKAAAEYLDKKMSRCDKTSYYLDLPDDGNSAYAFHRVGLISNPNHLTITACATEPMEVASIPWHLEVQVRRPEQPETTWSSAFAWDGELWRIESTTPADVESSALMRPGFVRQPGETVGLSVDIPKNHFGIELGQLEVRCRLGRSGGWQPLPGGWQTMDMTPPGFVIDLDAANRRVCTTRGGSFPLHGTAWHSSTWSGELELSLAVPARCRRLEIPLLKLELPIPATWEAVVKIPQDVPPGTHECWLQASCSNCGTRTSTRLVLHVHED